MTDKKISAMTAADTLDGTEIVPVLQGGANVRTTTQDIADLGSGGGGSGLEMIGLGGPTTARVHDFILPESGYSEFDLVLSGVTSSSTDPLACAFSNGTAFWNDPNGYDTYGAIYKQLDLQGSLVESTQGGKDLGGPLGVLARDIGVACDLRIRIVPGTDSVSLRYTSKAQSVFAAPSLSHAQLIECMGWLNRDATITPTFARATIMRIVSYDDGTSVRASGPTVTISNWTLFGVPTA